MNAKHVKRQAVPREYPDLFVEQLSRSPGVAGRYSLLATFCWSYVEECYRCRDIWAGFMHILLAGVPDSMNVEHCLWGRSLEAT